MAHELPPHMIKLFAPRPPLTYWEPLDLEKDPFKPCSYGNISDMLKEFQQYEAKPSSDIFPQYIGKVFQKYERKKAYLSDRRENALSWNPVKDEKIRGDPYCTLFVFKLHSEVTEDDLNGFFREFGPIKHCRLVLDSKGKSRKYGFIEFERERDMRDAYKYADGRRLKDRRIYVDVERGRVVKNWKPKKFAILQDSRERSMRKPLLS